MFLKTLLLIIFLSLTSFAEFNGPDGPAIGPSSQGLMECFAEYKVDDIYLLNMNQWYCTDDYCHTETLHLTSREGKQTVLFWDSNSRKIPGFSKTGRRILIGYPSTIEDCKNKVRPYVLIEKYIDISPLN